MHHRPAVSIAWVQLEAPAPNPMAQVSSVVVFKFGMKGENTYE